MYDLLNSRSNPTGGYISVNNTTTTPLVGDAVFTGTKDEVYGFSSVSVFIYTDVASAANGLSLELSADGINWDRKKTVTVTASVSQVHTLSVVTRYFRVVYTNGPDDQTTVRIQSIYHSGRGIGVSSGTQQTLQPWDDVLLVRPVSDATFDRNTGQVSYESSVQKFGRNADVGTGAFEDVWTAGGAYNWLQSASAVRVRAGGHADDDSGGAGAQKIIVEGLDSNWVEASEEITLAGASVSSATSTSFIRVHRAYVTDAGAYTGTNTGAILVETTGGTLVAEIPAGLGQTQMAIYTIPAGKTGYLVRLKAIVSAGANKTATVRFWRRESADDVATPFVGKRIISEFDEVAGEVVEKFVSWVSLPEKTDVWFDAVGDSNATLVDCVFSIILVDD